MKTPSPPKPRSDAPKRSFAWGVRSIGIAWTQPTEEEGASEGCNADCCAVTPLDKPRKKRPGRASTA